VVRDLVPPLREIRDFPALMELEAIADLHKVRLVRALVVNAAYSCDRRTSSSAVHACASASRRDMDR
jgi:hypothetical protein